MNPQTQPHQSRMPATTDRPRRLARYGTMALASATASATVAGTADASTVVSTALNNKKVTWQSGSNNARSLTVNTSFGGLLGSNGGFKIATRATANGGSSTGSFFGVVIEWQGGGGGQFLRSGSGLNQALLANFGATQSASSSAAFANVNLGTSNGYNSGNAAFSGTSPGTSRYLLFNFTDGTSTYYGWIEILATTTGVSGTGPFTSGYSATLGRWAYDTSGTAITAGQIIPSAVPGGTGLAALAFGAAGLRGRRRSRN